MLATIEITLYVARHALFEGGEGGIKSCLAEIFHLRLGKILIAVANRFGHLDIFDHRFAAERRKHRRDQIAKAPRLTGADVKDPRDRRRLEEPANHADRIFDVNEIARLFAVADPGTVRFEQTYRPAGLGVGETLGDEAHHLAFVVFIRAEHVEEFKSHPLRRQFALTRGAFDDGEVEQMLAPAVEVHRLQSLERRERIVIDKACLAIAIGRGGGGIDKGRPRSRTPIEQAQRQPEIGFDDVVGVRGSRRRDRAEVDHRIELTAIEPWQEFGGWDEIGKLAAGEIAPLGVAAEDVTY